LDNFLELGRESFGEVGSEKRGHKIPNP